jgi:hypothetical protein
MICSLNNQFLPQSQKDSSLALQWIKLRKCPQDITLGLRLEVIVILILMLNKYLRKNVRVRCQTKTMTFSSLPTKLKKINALEPNFNQGLIILTPPS